MTLIPGLMALMAPVFSSMLAFSGLLLLHVPPDTVAVNAPDVSGHNVVGPLIDPGGGVTVTTVVALHAPAPNV